MTTPHGGKTSATFEWTLRGPAAQTLPLALVDLAGCWSIADVRQVAARSLRGRALPVRLSYNHLSVAHVRAADWPVTLRLTFAHPHAAVAHGVRLSVRAGTALLLPRAQRAAAVAVSSLAGPVCGAQAGLEHSPSRLRRLVAPVPRHAPTRIVRAAPSGRRVRRHRPRLLPRTVTRPTLHHIDHVTLVSPVPPNAARTFVWQLAGEPPTPWQQISSLRLVGCWARRDVRGVIAVTAAGRLLPVYFTAHGLLLRELDDVMLPVTVSLTLDTIHQSALDAVSVVMQMRPDRPGVETGQDSADAWLRSRAAGPVCGTPPPTATSSGTPTSTVTPTAAPSTTATRTAGATNTATSTATPSPPPSPTATATPTQSPTATPTLPPTATNTPVPADTPTNTPVPTNTPTLTPAPTSTSTQTLAPTDTATNSPLPTNTATSTATNSPLPTDTPSPTISPTATSTNTVGAPGAPTDVTAAPSDGQVTVFWAIPQNTGTSPISDYQVFVSDGSVVDVGSAATSAVVGGLTNGVAYTFTVSAINAAGAGPRSLPSSTVTPFALPPDPASVAPSPDLSVATTVFSATQFLYSGPTPIQTGVSPGVMEITRTAVLRGRVLTRDGDPLSGVTITVRAHPEFGQTISRADGRFDLAVNGGGLLTVSYAAGGFLPAQRQVQTPWHDYVPLPDVALVPYDANVSTIDLSASNSAPVQVAQGSVISDSAGTRQATLLFTQGTTATMTLPDGTIRPLTTLHVRATEYSVGPNGPKAMPGTLPSNSGYTYAADFSADEAIAAGAISVTFSQPVDFYLQNFLHLPAGAIVPMGYYDQRKGQWIPSPNGRVLSIIDITTTNGISEAEIDVGAGQPATSTVLAALGITHEELRQLALLYQPGQSLWRVPLRHFTNFDT